MHAVLLYYYKKVLTNQTTTMKSLFKTLHGETSAATIEARGYDMQRIPPKLKMTHGVISIRLAAPRPPMNPKGAAAGDLSAPYLFAGNSLMTSTTPGATALLSPLDASGPRPVA
jgi:hypothetical protein